MRLLTALELVVVLIALHAAPSSPLEAVCAAGETTCNLGGGLPAHQHVALERASRRRLLMAGWAEATVVQPPQFVELVPVTEHSATGESVVQRRVFAHTACADRAEWRFIWPASLTEGFMCDDYAVGAINHDHCASDLGYEFEGGLWLTALQACPVACATCCSISVHCDEAPNPETCRQECSTSRSITTGGETVTVTDEFEKYLAHLDAHTPTVSTATGAWAMLQQHKNGVDTALTMNRTLFQVVPFEGGVFVDERQFRVFSATPLSAVRYTSDGSAPSATEGALATTVRFDRSVVVRAMGYLPVETQRTLAPSNISSVAITIKASPPIVTILECTIEGGEVLRFSAANPYANQTCSLAKVEIKARESLGRLANLTRLRYAVNEPDPGASNPQGQLRALLSLVGPARAEASSSDANNATDSAGDGVGVVASGPTRVSARAWRTGTMPSDAVLSPVVYLGVGQGVALGWMGTVGHWKMTRLALTGQYQRPLNRDQGCQERQPTNISPAGVKDAASLLGSAMLRGPACKGGVWDLDYTHSPNLTWFMQAAMLPSDTSDTPTPNTNSASDTVGDLDALGLRFDTLNRGLYVLDDVSMPLAEGMMPLETLSVEATLTIDTHTRIALAGIAAARLDGPSVSGVRYGKGWSVGYSVDLFTDSVTFIFALAVNGAELQPGFGGLVDVKAHVPRGLLLPGQLLHLVCVYDGAHAAIYLDGVLLTREHMCAQASCGAILYPLESDGLYTGGRRCSVTLGVIDSLASGQLASHQGTLRQVRIMKEALNMVQVQAAKTRALDLHLAEIVCSPGGYGLYEGLEPCVLCAPGTISVKLQTVACEKCAQNFYAANAGSMECFLCPDGFTTVEAASSACTNDACVLGTHDCDPLATCRSANSTLEGYTCVCARGFQGTGRRGSCLSVCGDGILAGAETCDDGGVRVGDGCSDKCGVEASFECSQSNGDGASVCICSGEAAQCCVSAHGICLRDVASKPHSTLTKSACLSEFVRCLTAAEQIAGRLESPDMPSLREVNSSRLSGLTRDVPLSRVRPVESACDPLQLARCEGLEEKCGRSRATEDQCLQLQASCLMAVSCWPLDQGSTPPPFAAP